MAFLASERFRFDRTDDEYQRGDEIDVSTWTQEEFLDAIKAGWIVPLQEAAAVAPVRAIVSASSVQQLPVSGADNDLAFDVVFSDPDGLLVDDVKFVAPSAGIYRLDVKAGIVFTTGETIVMEFYLNGANGAGTLIAKHQVEGSAAAQSQVELEDTFQLAAADEITVFCYPFNSNRSTYKPALSATAQVHATFERLGDVPA